MNENRIHWRDFIDTQAYMDVQNILSFHGQRLVVVFDANEVATDVYVEKHPAPV